jgi:hypothetical protein
MRAIRPKGFKKILISNNSLFEILKNIMEIIALLIGACWALYNFKLKDAPTLENSVASNCELHLDSLDGNKNIVKYLLHVKNIGKTSFEVDSVQVKYWLVPIDTMIKNAFFSADIYMKTKGANFFLTDYAFTYHYSPEKECTERYNFFLDQRPDCVLLINAEFFLHGRKGLFSESYFQDNTYTFKLHCVHD